MDVRYVSLDVNSIENEIEFCTQKLGYKVLSSTKFLNERHCVVLKGEQHKVGLILFEEMKNNNAKSTIILNTDDFLKDHYDLKDNGIEFLTEPEYTPLGLAAAFKDPSDNCWILVEEREYTGT